VTPKAEQESSEPVVQDVALFPKARIAWATLLARVHHLDVLSCPRPGCSGRMRPIAAILDPEAIRRILTHLGLPADPPTFERARDPPAPNRSPNPDPFLSDL
jgi:hypothetical protein